MKANPTNHNRISLNSIHCHLENTMTRPSPNCFSMGLEKSAGKGTIITTYYQSHHPNIFCISRPDNPVKFLG